MPTIKLAFPGGRYHATPWGHHVNEGQIEWPPSPWRLLRAFIAVGYATQHWEEVPDTGRRLIEQLASALPEYLLPPASSAHSRHYMPVGKLKKNKLEDSTLVFDTWANIGDGEIVIRWNCDLDDDCRELFEQLVANLGYVGRSESWVVGEVLHDDQSDLTSLASRVQTHSYPHEEGTYFGPEWEQVQLIASATANEYAAWRESQAKNVLKEHPLPEGKKPTQSLTKKRDAAVAPYPEDLLDCLQKDTSWWKGKHKWSQPPGSKRVLYWRRADALVVSHPKPAQRPEPEPVEAMLLAISSPSRNKSALPSVTRTLPQGELFHRAIVGRAARGGRIHCPELTGRQADGQPLIDNHKHAHVLSLDLDHDGHIDHVLVWAPMELGSTAQQAIRSAERTWAKGVGELQVAVVGRGNLTDLRHLPEHLRDEIDNLLGPPTGATTWKTATPYVPPRFVKRNGKNSLEGQVRSELQSRYGAELANLRVISPRTSDGQSRRFRHFIRVRNHGGKHPPVDAGYSVELELTEPKLGPICLGYGSHFGLGRFSAAPAEPEDNP